MVQKDAKQESEMRTEIQQMKKEQSSISMMDEFARYARLERKINKTTDKLKTHGKMKTNTHVHQFKRSIIPLNSKNLSYKLAKCSMCFMFIITSTA